MWHDAIPLLNWNEHCANKIWSKSWWEKWFKLVPIIYSDFESYFYKFFKNNFFSLRNLLKTSGEELTNILNSNPGCTFVILGYSLGKLFYIFYSVWSWLNHISVEKEDLFLIVVFLFHSYMRPTVFSNTLHILFLLLNFQNKF